MRDLIIGIQEDIQLGVLCFADIARKHRVPVSWVDEAWNMLCEQEAEAESFVSHSHDELERDHDEPYEPDYTEDAYLDASYEDRYELDTDYN